MSKVDFAILAAILVSAVVHLATVDGFIWIRDEAPSVVKAAIGW